MAAVGGAAGRDVLRRREPRDGADDGGAARADGRAAHQEPIREALASISGTFFGVFYVGWLLSHAVVLRQFTEVVAARWPDVAAGMHPDVGGFYLVFTISVVIAGDVGRLLRRAAPTGGASSRRASAPARRSRARSARSSPGRLMGVGLKAGFDFFAPELSRHLSYVAVRPDRASRSRSSGMIGDLIESLLKRDAAVKDTGTLAARHGRRARPHRLEPDRDPGHVLRDARLHLPDGRLATS